ncbi:Carnitine 3-dehydrogenase OS=Castellaniella defragrans OX=75697 GN=HNR28_003470 PE=4 SV=1 [Castellaniella defragrans]
MNPIRKVAVIGCGVIGASWSAYFLAHGLEVTAFDPAPNAEEALQRYVAQVWPTLQKQAKGNITTDPSQLRFEKDLEPAVREADFIQENAPERLPIKHQLLADIEVATRPDTLIASSSSGLLVSDIQQAMQHPDRLVLGHPFNPPHLMPLVEVIGGKRTSAQSVQRAISFYQGIGKKPIHVRKEVRGHVANRLQAALWREAFYLIEQDVISVADLDTAISQGPGLRWALLGPLVNLALSGGKEGLAHTLEHLGPPMADWWKDLGDVELTPALTRKLVAGLEEELQGLDQDTITKRRDALLCALLDDKARLLPEL